MLTVKSLSKVLVPALALGALVGGVSANAQTFAQQNTTTTNPFEFLNSGAAASSGLTATGSAAANVAASIPVTFYFTAVAPSLGYAGPTGPVNSINALLTINNATVAAPTSPLTAAGNYDTQLADTTVGPTFAYTVNGNQTISGFNFLNGQNLLSVFLSGGAGFTFSAEGTVGQTANIIQSNGSGGTSVTYSSAFLSLGSQFAQNFGYTFIDASSNNSVGANGILNTNTYNGQAIFSLNVQRSAVPEPGTVAMLAGMGTTGLGLLARRRRK